MGKHARRAADRRYLRLVASPADELEIRHAGVDDLELVDPPTAGATGAEVSARPEHADRSVAAAERAEPGEPEEYGVRVTWQSEAVRIEAAEFLIATRMQQDARIRASHVLAGLRRRRQHSSR
jgi:hypothetical protein